MNTQADIPAIGLFEPRYVAFLETITHLRARLHRYCARMTGSPLDGEDVMQEVMFEACLPSDSGPHKAGPPTAADGRFYRGLAKP